MDAFAFELAKTFFAGISAAAAAIQVWLRFRDAQKAAATFDATFEETAASAEATAAAAELTSIIPEDVVEDLEHRADSCWTSYRKVLGGLYLPDEIDNATDSVQACVCRELGRIYKLGGFIPERWMGQWQRYNCGEADQPESLEQPLSKSPYKAQQRPQQATKPQTRKMSH